MKIKFHNKDELTAFIRLIQEIVLTLEAALPVERNPMKRYEMEAQIELLEEIYPKLSKKQFNNQEKNHIKITKAVALIIFQYRDIALDVYADLIRNRVVQDIHKEMV